MRNKAVSGLTCSSNCCWRGRLVPGRLLPLPWPGIALCWARPGHGPGGNAVKDPYVLWPAVGRCCSPWRPHRQERLGPRAGSQGDCCSLEGLLGAWRPGPQWSGCPVSVCPVPTQQSSLMGGPSAELAQQAENKTCRVAVSLGGA